ncbi:unnamed protein product, partial [Mycena citricolor]
GRQRATWFEFSNIPQRRATGELEVNFVDSSIETQHEWSQNRHAWRMSRQISIRTHPSPTSSAALAYSAREHVGDQRPNVMSDLDDIGLEAGRRNPGF